MGYGFIRTNNACTELANTIKPRDVVFFDRGPDPNVLISRFGKFETESAAGKLVRFFQFQEAWMPFYIGQVREFYHLKGWPEDVERPLLSGLTNSELNKAQPFGRFDGFVRITDNGECMVTDTFILICAGKGRYLLSDFANIR